MICAGCQSAVPETAAFCPNCGRSTEPEKPNPKRESLAEQGFILPDPGPQEDLIEQMATEERRRGVMTILFIAGIQLFFSIIVFAFAQFSVGFFVSLSVGFVFLAIFFWSKRNPKAAILTALTLYVTLILIDLVLAPVTIFFGIIVKIVIIVLLLNALRIS